MKKITCNILLLISSLVIVSACQSSGASSTNGLNETPYSKTELLMGTVTSIKIYDEDKEYVLDPVFKRIEELDRLISTESEESEIKEINDHAGIRPVEVSDDIYNLIKTGKEYSDESDGYFDISIGPLTSLWRIGYDDAKLPSEAEIEEALQIIDYQAIELNEKDQTVFLRKEGMKLDLGAIAKGYISDEVLHILEEEEVTSAVIDLGGNIYVVGQNARGEDWRVGVQNPFISRGEIAGRIETQNKTVVTTGIYERFLEIDGERFHHVLNPETGYPFESDIAGVTIVTDLSIDGDTLSTFIFAIGMEEGLAYIENREDTEAIIVTTDRTIYISSGLKNKFEVTNDTFNLVEIN